MENNILSEEEGGEEQKIILFEHRPKVTNYSTPIMLATLLAVIAYKRKHTVC